MNLNLAPIYFCAYLAIGGSALWFSKLGIKKFRLMSRGFAGRGGNQKISDTQDFSNFIQAFAGDGDVTVKLQLRSEPVEPQTLNLFKIRNKSTTSAWFLWSIAARQRERCPPFCSRINFLTGLLFTNTQHRGQRKSTNIKSGGL